MSVLYKQKRFRFWLVRRKTSDVILLKSASFLLYSKKCLFIKCGNFVRFHIIHFPNKQWNKLFFGNFSSRCEEKNFPQNTSPSVEVINNYLTAFNMSPSCQLIYSCLVISMKIKSAMLSRGDSYTYYRGSTFPPACTFRHQIHFVESSSQQSAQAYSRSRFQIFRMHNSLFYKH